MLDFSSLNTDIEGLIGGKYIIKRYGVEGKVLHEMAENGDKKAINIFNEIGMKFGAYLSSVIMLLDPEVIIIGGSFSRSLKFMLPSIKEEIKNHTIRKKIKIYYDKNKYSVLEGAYFIDEYEKIDNKL